MILEHEIPQGSKLYFANTAKVKRSIEAIAAEILEHHQFEEIVTPIFSHHQHLSIANESELIRINDRKNNPISLRADATIDVVRIIKKRLGGNTSQKKWFYIQPVYRYPTEEQYQIGVEFMGEKNLSSVLNIANEIFAKLEVDALVQISNMKIPHIIADMFDALSIDDFRHINIDKFLSLNVDWLSKLVYLQHESQVDELIALVPDALKIELKKMKDLCNESGCHNSVLAPMYYAKMLYYDELFFRVIKNNEVYARGGRYNNDDVSSVGFAIYTDEIIESKVK